MSLAVDEVVRRVVAMFAPEHVTVITPEATLLGDLGFSSLRLIELAFTLEELFEMDPAAMGEAPPVGTVGEVRDFLMEKVAAGQASVPSVESVDAFAAGAP